MKKKQFLAYSASAGSGKTYALALRYIALLFMGQKPGEILAATFTKKAANEMQQRVLKLLQNLDKEETFLKSLVTEYNLDRAEILAKQKQILSLFLKSQNHIITLDSFCNSILRSAALQIGLEPDFTIKQNSNSELEEHFIEMLDRYGEIDSLVKLSINLQKRRSEEIVDLFGTLFAIDALLPKSNYSVRSLEPILESIESLRKEIVRELEQAGAAPRAIGQFSVENTKELLGKKLFENESLGEHSWFKKYSNDTIERLYRAIKEQMREYHIALESTILHYLFELYNRYKSVRLDTIRGKGELNFVDILYLTHKLLDSEITKEFLYFKLDTKFKHILLDEFQDTSALQYLILKPLIDEIFAGVGQSDFRTFFYVGDVKQSLYRFRGGVEELFSYVANEHGMEVATLDTNYRSARNIVAITNSWFRDKIEGFVPQKANSKQEGYVEVTKSEELLERAKERIVFLQSKGVVLEDLALLVFANKDGIALQEYLKQHGIESVLKSASSLKFNKKVAALVGVIEYLLTKEPIFLEPFKQKLALESVDLSWCKQTMEPFEFLVQIIEKFGYYHDDLNILRLLDFAKNFSTLEEFLEEFKESNIELAPNTQKGVEIMTIHGSKGLEFKYVIVLDRLGKNPPNRDMLLFKNATPVKIERIFYKQSKKEYFVKEYAEAKAREEAMSYKDRLNLLYVALTRAELGLIVVAKEKGSQFESLDLEPMQIGEIIASEPAKEESLEVLSSIVSSYGRQEVEQLEQEEQEQKDYKALKFGEALHFALEMLEFSDPQSLKSAMEAVVNHYGSQLEPSQLESIEKRLQKLFSCQEFYTLIEGAKLHKEQPIVYKEKFYQLDLLAKSESFNRVFDYKSSKNFAKKHRAQVKNYIEALKSIEKKECEGYILYILENGVEIERV